MKKLLLLLSAALVSLSIPQFCLHARSSSEKARILMVVTSSPVSPEGDLGYGYHPVEAGLFYKVMHSHGYTGADIDVISPEGGKAPMYARSAQMENDIRAIGDGLLLNKLDNTLQPADIDPDQYRVIYYAGGIACTNDFPDNMDLARIAARIYENGGIVAAVCDGITGLLPVTLSNGEHLLKGKTVAPNGYLGSYMRELGATVVPDAPPYGKAAVSERIVTAPNVQPVPVALEVAKLLEEVVGVEENQENSAFGVMPQPMSAQGRIVVDVPAGSIAIGIHDLTGSLRATVYEGFTEGGRQEYTVQAGNLADGIYLLRVRNAGKIWSRPLQIMK